LKSSKGYNNLSIYAVSITTFITAAVYPIWPSDFELLWEPFPCARCCRMPYFLSLPFLRSSYLQIVSDLSLLLAPGQRMFGYPQHFLLKHSKIDRSDTHTQRTHSIDTFVLSNLDFLHKRLNLMIRLWANITLLDVLATANTPIILSHIFIGSHGLTMSCSITFTRVSEQRRRTPSTCPFSQAT
jgi:hypothetical protein